MAVIVSGGVMMKSPTVVWQGNTVTWGNWPASLSLGNRWASYSQIYRSQIWVAVLVNKLGRAKARLPLKVYERADKGRPEARNSPYAELLRKPNTRWSPFFTWLWTDGMENIYGESFLGKIRDRGGRPVELVPLHPTAMKEEEEKDGRTIWTFQNGTVRITDIPDEDLFHPRSFNPDSITRGLSPLEPLRMSLENEDAARRANRSFWLNGARPGTVLKHPGKLSPAAEDRLAFSWNQVARGPDNFGRTVVLQEGMEPEMLTLSAEEAQFIQSHRMHTEEACAIYDVPPPVVHILDHATFSNITEQMRSMYRDTMAPRLKSFEAELEVQLRGSVRPGQSEPDFGDEVYAEFLLDEVLRGDFEVRMESYQKAINSGQLTPAEAREKENLPFIEGSDVLMVNSTMVPLEQAVEPPPPPPPPMLPPSGGEPPPEEAPALDEAAMRMVMGRLSRPKTLAEVDLAALVTGLNGAAVPVFKAWQDAQAVGDDVAGLRARLKELGHAVAHRVG